MAKYNPIKDSVAERRQLENMKADIVRNKAHSDYVAMMCGIELPDSTENMEVIHHEA